MNKDFPKIVWRQILGVFKKNIVLAVFSVQKIILRYTLDMPTVFRCVLSSSIINFFCVLIPTILILSTAGMVLYAEDGLIENIDVHEKILRFENKTSTLVTTNAKLRHEIYVLKLRKEKLLHRTSFDYLAAPEGSQIYRFESSSK